MGSIGGNASQGSSQQSSEPWKGQQPYLKDIYRRAAGMKGDEWSYYPDSTVAGQDPATTEAYGMVEDRARAGSPLVDAAQQETLSTIRGDRFNSNPYLDATYDKAAAGATRAFNRTVLPNLESRFAGGNRLNSGGYQNSLREAGRGLASELGGMATDIYGQDYARERGAQLNATQNAVPLSEADYLGAEHLGQVGAGRQSYAQSVIDDLVSRFEFNQQSPYNAAARYSSLIGAPVMESQGSAKNSSWGFTI